MQHGHVTGHKRERERARVISTTIRRARARASREGIRELDEETWAQGMRERLAAKGVVATLRSVPQTTILDQERNTTHGGN